jgi:ribosome biogenesis protein Nip4
LTFAAPSRPEEIEIVRGLERYLEPSSVSQLLQEKQLLIGRGDRREVYLLSAPLWQLYQKACTQRHPYFVGLHLGELKAEGFVPSLHSLPHLAAGPRKAAVVVTTADGAQRFMYGRDLDADQLKQVPPKAEGREILVVNHRGEGIGFGTLATDKQGKAVLKNRTDLGWYLRRGQ